MTYLFLEWVDSNTDEPGYWYHELDEQRYEHRRVMIFHDGRMQWLNASNEDESWWLSAYPMPSLEELEVDPEFKQQEISRAEFNEIWQKALADDNENTPQRP